MVKSPGNFSPWIHGARAQGAPRNFCVLLWVELDLFFHRKKWDEFEETRNFELDAISNHHEINHESRMIEALRQRAKGNRKIELMRNANVSLSARGNQESKKEVRRVGYMHFGV